MIGLAPERVEVAEERIREELARRDFIEFLALVRIQEPHPGRGTIPFEPWPHLMELVASLREHRLVIVLKSRQVGVSWLLSAWALWTMLFHHGAMVLMLSKGQEEAETLLEKARFIRTQLPPGLQMLLRVDNASEMAIRGGGSRILALPATESAGRSETSTLVIQDEADYHEHLEANFAAVKPTIDAMGQLIMVSTADKLHPQSFFKGIYRSAPANGFRKLFIPWTARPGRDATWFEATKKAVPISAKMTPELYMEQEYPSVEEEALAPSREIMALEGEVLKRLAGDEREPMETRGVANIYQRPSIGRQYMAGTDTSHGVGRDFGATGVIDAQTGFVVADICSSTLTPEELEFESEQLLKGYFEPIWVIEDNDWGRVVLARAVERGYPHLYYRDGAKTQPGFRTDDRTRWTLWGEFLQALRDGLIVIPSREGIRQLWGLIRNPEKGGRIEAMGGAHDDYPNAVALAWQMRKEVVSREGGGTVFDMRPKVRQRSIW